MLSRPRTASVGRRRALLVVRRTCTPSGRHQSPSARACPATTARRRGRCRRPPVASSTPAFRRPSPSRRLRPVATSSRICCTTSSVNITRTGPGTPADGRRRRPGRRHRAPRRRSTTPPASTSTSSSLPVILPVSAAWRARPTGDVACVRRAPSASGRSSTATSVGHQRPTSTVHISNTRPHTAPAPISSTAD